VPVIGLVPVIVQPLAPLTAPNFNIAPNGSVLFTLQLYQGHGPRHYEILEYATSVEVGNDVDHHPHDGRIIIQAQDATAFLMDAWQSNKVECDYAYHFFGQSLLQLNGWVMDGTLTVDEYCQLRYASDEEFHGTMTALISDAQILLRFPVVQMAIRHGYF
jgi:hypothetical protein